MWGWPEVQKKQLGLLKKEYNKALIRYNNMCKWMETASEEEQSKNFKLAVEVINNSARLLNEIKKLDPLVTPQEILNGFK